MPLWSKLLLTQHRREEVSTHLRMILFHGHLAPYQAEMGQLLWRHETDNPRGRLREGVPVIRRQWQAAIWNNRDSLSRGQILLRFSGCPIDRDLFVLHDCHFNSASMHNEYVGSYPIKGLINGLMGQWRYSDAGFWGSQPSVDCTAQASKLFSADARWLIWLWDGPSPPLPTLYSPASLFPLCLHRSSRRPHGTRKHTAWLLTWHSYPDFTSGKAKSERQLSYVST